MLYLFVYMRITAHNEFELIRNNVPGAAISLGLSLLGFTLPVVSAMTHAANVIDCLIWSIIALIVQVIVYYAVRIPVPICPSASRTANSRPRSGSALPRSPPARSTPRR